MATPQPHVTEAGIAMVPILGPLFARGDWLPAMVGASVYGDIAATIQAAARA